MADDRNDLNPQEYEQAASANRQGEPSLRASASGPDAELIQELEGLYQPQTEAIQRRLKRVWGQVEQRQAAIAARRQQRVPGVSAEQYIIPQERLHPMQAPRHLLSGGGRWSSRFGVLITIAALVVLVGGLTLGLVLVRHNGSGTAHPQATQTATATSTPAPTSTPTPPPNCPTLPAGRPEPAAPPSLYLVSESSVIALNAGDGSIRWQHQVEGIEFFNIALDNNTLYTTYGSAVIALNAASGAMLWCIAAPGPEPELTAGQGTVYIGSAMTPKVIAVRGSDGARLWTTSISPNTGLLSALDGELYVSTQSDGLYSYLDALDIHTGALLWKQKTASDKAFSWPAVANGIVYVSEQPISGGAAGALDAFDARSGARRWQVAESQGVNLSFPVVANGLVYFTDTWGVYALNARDGSLRWRVQAANSAIPSVANGLLYFQQTNLDTDVQSLRALSASDGSNRWSWPTAGGLAAQGAAPLAPRSSGHPLLYTVGNGAVYAWLVSQATALDASSGAQRWQKTLEQSDAVPYLLAG